VELQKKPKKEMDAWSACIFEKLRLFDL